MTNEPIAKLLAASGAGSRRQMTAAIKEGRVALNGKIVESFVQPVDKQRDKVTIDGKPVVLQTGRHVYLMLNKPGGVISAAGDERGEKTAVDLIPPKYANLRLYPVGRLDKDSTGLLLLTNDGDLTYRLTHPRFENEKEYLLRIEGRLNPKEKAELEKGIELDDGVTSPARVKHVAVPPFNYSIVIHEGRKRQVRRMFARLGYTVLELKRVRFGRLTLGSLPEGHVRELTPAELKALKKG